jgi:microfibrillar-associated protein 1
MQSLYKPGAFYRDKDIDVLKRDYNMPTGEDKMDKSILPAVL